MYTNIHIRFLKCICAPLFTPAERTLEDHESVGDAYRMWPASCTYRFVMRRNMLKYDLFIHPEVPIPLQALAGVRLEDYVSL